jgi:LmbE family N-acetylglucosaminyl deacetylase
MRVRVAALTAALLAGCSLVGNGAEAASMPPSLFVFAHPDDETLAASVAIAEHVRAGQEVHVLILTEGRASGVLAYLNGTGVNAWWGVQHDPEREGYAELSPADFGAARRREAVHAVDQLATGYPGTAQVHQGGLPDAGVTRTAALAAIREVADQIAPGAPVRLKGHSHIVDNNPDHVAIGEALRDLAAEDPARFGGVRHYVLPMYWNGDARLALVAENWDNPADSGVVARARNACRVYAAWSPPESFAIGYHSVPAAWAVIEPSPKSLYHP